MEIWNLEFGIFVLFPVLFSLGFLTLHTSSVIIAIGFLVSLFFFWKLTRIEIIEEEKIFDFAISVIFGSLIFGRILYVLENINDFQFKVDRILHIYKYPGFEFWGIAFGGLIIGKLFLYKSKIKSSFFLDVFVVCLSLFLSFVFLGFFFDGNFVGFTSQTLGVQFVGYIGKRFPIQLPAALFFFIFFLVFKNINFKRQKGLVFWSFIFITFLIFLALEFLRQDRIYFEMIVINKFMFFLVVLFSSVIILIKYKNKILSDLRIKFNL